MKRLKGSELKRARNGTIMLGIRMMPDERDELERVAALSGEEMSTYARFLIRKHLEEQRESRA